jgi:dCMP deaminase
MILLAYIPVLHSGYGQFLNRHKENAQRSFVLGEELIGEFPHLRKDLRALEAPQVVRAIKAAWGIQVLIATPSVLVSINSDRYRVVMPNEDISHELAERHLPHCPVQFDSSVHLRWDRISSLSCKEVKPDRTAPTTELDGMFMERAFAEAQTSWDWWRQVGAVASRGETVLYVARNRHMPSEYALLEKGDPRGNFKKGVHIELSTAQHAEAAIIARAAREGVALDGASFYVTTFPCPSCAKLIAESGIRRLFFREGYAVLDGEAVLRANGVEIIHLSPAG